MTSTDDNILARILNNLRFKSKGMTITELSRKTGINRNSVAKYLQILLVSGQVDVQTVGNAKVYTFSQRLPISSFLSASSNLIAVINNEGTIVDINDAFIQFFGLEREKCIATTLENTSVPILRDSDIASTVMDEIDGDGKFQDISLMHEEKTHYFHLKYIPSVLEGGCRGIVLVIEDITEKIHSARALKESEALFSSTIDSVTDVVYVINPDFKIEKFNQHFERLCMDHGLDPGDVIDQDLFDAFQLIPESFRDCYNKVLLSGESYLSEEELSWDDKKYITEISIIPVVDTDEVRHIVTTIHNLTKERRAEDLLSENDDALRNFFENSNNGMFITSVNAEGRAGDLLMVNERFCDMLQYSAQELLPLPLYMITSSEYTEQYINGLSQGVLGDLIKQNCEFRRKDGSTFSVESFTHICYYDKMSVFLSLVRNLSERGPADHTHTDTSDEIHMAVQSTNLGIWHYNPGNDSIKLGGCFDRITGYGPDECPDTFDGWAELVHPDDVSSLRRAIYEHLGDRSDLFEQDLRIRHKDGHWIWGNMLGRITRCDDNGQPSSMSGIFRDISEAHLYEKALREANKKLNVLSRVIRHDVLNQITAAMVYLDLLEEQLPENPDAHEYIRQVQIITRKIQNQVSFSRAFQNLGVRPPVWQCINSIAQRAQRDVPMDSVKVRISTGSLEVFADPLLERVFLIIFSNVIQHAAGATELEISFSEMGDHGVLVFEDNGSGISENLKNRIFDWGFGKDSGSGLYIAKEILGITCLSIMETGIEGEGARFEIFLPPKSFRNI